MLASPEVETTVMSVHRAPIQEDLSLMTNPVEG